MYFLGAGMKAFSDKSRDYTLPDLSLLVGQKVPGVAEASAATTGGWQNGQVQTQYAGYGGSPYMYPSADPTGASPSSGHPPYYG